MRFDSRNEHPSGASRHSIYVPILSARMCNPEPGSTSALGDVFILQGGSAAILDESGADESSKLSNERLPSAVRRDAARW